MSHVQIRLLGPVDVRVGDEPLAVDTRKAVAALAYLAVTGRPSSRESLAALLWPESDERDARGALRRTLSVLNAALGTTALAIDRTTVELREAEVTIDVRRFRDALARARSHAHDPDQACPACLATLDEGAALDRGEFMAGFALRDSPAFDDWQLAESEAHRRDLAALLERLARGRAAGAEWDPAIVAARRWLELDPLHEPAHRLLMTIYAHAGEPAAAIHQYRDCVRVLDAELGVAPLAETTELYESIRTGGLAGMRPSAPSEATIVPDAAPAPARGAGGSQPLVGRAAQLEAMLAAHRSIGPDGRLIVVQGEAGIGKTRLLVAFGDALAAQGAVVLGARAHAGEASIAYGPIVELLRAGLRDFDSARLRELPPQVVADVARIVPIADAHPGQPAIAADPFGRTRLLDGLAAFIPALVAGSQPGIVAIDDLHLADASTIEAIAYLVRRLPGRPFGIVLSWRSEELAPAVRGLLLGAGGREHPATVIDLARFDRGEVAELARVTLGSAPPDDVVDALLDESEGLPLYLAERLASGASPGPLPGGVRELLHTRIAMASEMAAQILAAASVIGRSFGLQSVRAASGRGAEETVDGLDELVRRGLIREIGPLDGDLGYDFTHGRLRDVVYEDLSLARRRLLHGRVADACESGPLGRAVPEAARWALIAQHRALAGRDGDAAEAHVRAANEQRRVFANDEAAAHVEAALALGHPAVAALHEQLGELLTLRGDYAGAIAHLETAAASTGRTGGDGASTATIEHRLALVQARRGDWARAASHAEAAATSATDDARRSQILADRSAIALQAGDLDAAAKFAADAVRLASEDSGVSARAAAEHIAGVVARRRGHMRAAATHLHRALELSADGDPSLRVAVLNSSALVSAETGDRGRAIELTTEALELCRRLGDRHRQAALENNLADLFHATGRDDESMEHLKRAVALFAEIDPGPGELEPEIWKLVEW